MDGVSQAAGESDSWRSLERCLLAGGEEVKEPSLDQRDEESRRGSIPLCNKNITKNKQAVNPV